MKYTETDYSAISKYLLGKDPARRYCDDYFGCISLFDSAYKNPFKDNLDREMRKFRRFLNSEGVNSFIDVGCGMGAVMFAVDKVNKYASDSKMKIHGIELHRDYIEVFEELKEKMFHCPDNAQIFEMDAFEFKNYSDYEFVFAYNPISSTPLYKNLVIKIWSDMKKGSYFFDPYNCYIGNWIDNYEIVKRLEFTKHDENPIFQKL